MIAHRAYFAYGSNMDVNQMADRCPSAEIVGVCRLDRHRFIINRRGVATLVPDAASCVLGILWDLPPEDEQSLDEYEGVPTYYQKHLIVVETDREAIQALIYLAADRTPGRSRPGYMEEILAAARQYKFDETYLSELSIWVPE
jgi:hypothetical protein